MACAFPFSPSLVDGTCTVVNFGVPAGVLVALIAIIMACVVASMSISLAPALERDWRQWLAATTLIGLPSACATLNLLYLLSSEFQDWRLCGLTYLLVAIMTASQLLLMLRNLNADPKWYILAPPASLLLPAYSTMSAYSTMVSPTLSELTAYSLLLISPWILLNTLLWVPIFIVGCFLFSSTLLTLRQPRLLWFYLWSGGLNGTGAGAALVGQGAEHYFNEIEEEDRGAVPALDIDLYADYFYTHSLTVVLPQLLLQVYLWLTAGAESEAAFVPAELCIALNGVLLGTVVFNVLEKKVFSSRLQQDLTIPCVGWCGVKELDRFERAVSAGRGIGYRRVSLDQSELELGGQPSHSGGGLQCLEDAEFDDTLSDDGS